MLRCGRLIGNFIWIILLTCVFAKSSVADPSIHAKGDLSSQGGRAIEDDLDFDTGEIVDGKCASVFVTASHASPGRALISAEIPFSENGQQGEIYFCGGTAKQCATPGSRFHKWVDPLHVTDDDMALSPFSPSANQHVTIVKVTPDGDPEGPTACMEEIKMGEIKGDDGLFTMRASGLGSHVPGQDARTLLAKIRASAAQDAREQDLLAEEDEGQPEVRRRRPQRAPEPEPPAEPEYEFTRNDRMYDPNLGLNYDLQDLVPQYPQYNNEQNQPTQMIENTYQAIAQARADAMARQQTLSHAIGGAPGIPNVSEGIGMGPSSLPETCFFTGPLLADASSQDANGYTYRVRFFNGGQYIGGRI